MKTDEETTNWNGAVTKRGEDHVYGKLRSFHYAICIEAVMEREYVAMSLFDKFKGKTVEAQAVETKPGSWKEHLHHGGGILGSMYNDGVAVKLAALAGFAMATAFTGPVGLGLMGIFAIAHVGGSVVKAEEQTSAQSSQASAETRKQMKAKGASEEETRTAHMEAQAKVPSVAKNFIKQVIRPF